MLFFYERRVLKQKNRIRKIDQTNQTNANSQSKKKKLCNELIKKLDRI